ncbi:hypothetical protein FA95DRAFT_1467866, partial [Auriscalpium vulgare]
MGRKGWTTPSQEEWLEQVLTRFLDTNGEQPAKKKWWEATYADWFKKFPLPPPSAEQVEKAGGDLAAAAAEARLKQHNRVYHWIHNHTRNSTSGTDNRGVLDLGAKPK